MSSTMAPLGNVDALVSSASKILIAHLSRAVGDFKVPQKKVFGSRTSAIRYYLGAIGYFGKLAHPVLTRF